MIPFLLALSCLTNITNDCTHPTPIMNYQLKNIWSPTNPYLSKVYENGTWTTTRKPPDMRALRGRTLKVAIIDDEPFVSRKFENDTIAGVAKTILGVLRESLGFDWKFVWPRDNQVGIKNESNEYTGLVKLLKDKEADFAITYMSMIEERLDVLDFSRPFGEERWVIMMSRPQETTDGDGLVAPFQTEVWYYLIVSLVLMGPLIYGLIRLRCMACKGHPTLSVYYSLGHSIWFVYGALMKQGSVLKPIADSSRILFATWWIFVTILTAFYTANLTAYLTLSKIPIPFDQLSKVGYRDYWVARRGDTLEAVVKAKPTPKTDTIDYKIESTRYPEFYKLRYRLSSGYGKFMDNTTDMIEQVRRNKYLLLDEQSRVERIIYKDFRAQSKKQTPLHKRCAFIMSRHPIFRVAYGMAFPKGSEFKPIFDPILEKLSKAGLFNYWRRQDLPVKDPCSADSDFRERQLRNGDLMTTYILCGSGYLLALVTFFMEVIHKFVTGRKISGQLVPSDKNNQMSFYKGNLSVPTGAPTFFDTEKFLRNINGKDYVVMKMPDGRTKLVPKNVNDGIQALQPPYNPNPPISYSFMS